MKRILVVSDTHNYIKKLEQLLERISDDIDYVFHLGDLCTDIKSFIPRYSDIKFYAVAGNCDYTNYAERELNINICNSKIFLTHGSLFDVKYSSEKIVYAAMERKADICLFGHTHSPALYKYNGIVFMNPGSLSLPRDTRYSTYGVINFSDDGASEFSIVAVEKESVRVIDSNSF